MRRGTGTRDRPRFFARRAPGDRGTMWRADGTAAPRPAPACGMDDDGCAGDRAWEVAFHLPGSTAVVAAWLYPVYGPADGTFLVGARYEYATRDRGAAWGYTGYEDPGGPVFGDLDGAARAARDEAVALLAGSGKYAWEFLSWDGAPW